MADSYPQEVLAPPEVRIGVLCWVRENLFRNTFDSIVTISVILFLLRIVPAVLSRLFFDAASFSGDEAMCRSVNGICWPFIREKVRLILFGTYPYVEQWRAALASLTIIGLVAILMLKRLKFIKMISLWVAGTTAFVGFMMGGVLGMPEVQTVKWNGLPVFLLLAVFSLVAAFPLGVLLALARHQKNNLLIRNLAGGYIELIRGVPLLTVLFMGLFILSLMLPKGFFIEPLTLVCQPDQGLESILFWGFQVMLTAEKYGVTSKNVNEVVKDLANQPKAVRRLLGEKSAAGDMAEKLKIPRNWTYKIIKQVGNYGEVFERHLGKGTPFELARKGTPNDLSSRGGLMYAYPIR